MFKRLLTNWLENNLFRCGKFWLIWTIQDWKKKKQIFTKRCSMPMERRSNKWFSHQFPTMLVIQCKHILLSVPFTLPDYNFQCTCTVHRTPSSKWNSFTMEYGRAEKEREKNLAESNKNARCGNVNVERQKPTIIK